MLFQTIYGKFQTRFATTKCHYILFLYTSLLLFHLIRIKSFTVWFFTQTHTILPVFTSLNLTKKKCVYHPIILHNPRLWELWHFPSLKFIHNAPKLSPNGHKRANSSQIVFKGCTMFQMVKNIMNWFLKLRNGASWSGMTSVGPECGPLSQRLR